MARTLEGKTALVTGGAKGYGAGITASLYARGAEVWITGRDEAALRGAADQLGAKALPADATSRDDWDRVVRTLLDATGRIDILVNNAGAGILIAPMAEQDDDAMDACIALNLLGPLYGCRRVAPIMQEQGDGVMVNISSGCALHAWPGWGPYSAAKAGLNQLGHCLNTELRPHGVRVSTITPYWGATGFRAASSVEAATEDIEQKMMQPSEMGEMVAQICELPAHLVVPDVTVQPLVQEIIPM